MQICVHMFLYAVEFLGNKLLHKVYSHENPNKNVPLHAILISLLTEFRLIQAPEKASLN